MYTSSPSYPASSLSTSSMSSNHTYQTSSPVSSPVSFQSSSPVTSSATRKRGSGDEEPIRHRDSKRVQKQRIFSEVHTKTVDLMMNASRENQGQEGVGTETGTETGTEPEHGDESVGSTYRQRPYW
ncbi:hypothetical protein CLIB1423_23S00540 [[Candida] railenensis]|uniref:Uncharacterized protein n=1 Tax=[Candida] railenensis TaxID=45579 RepID=A0A9P0QT92_9ASCO|nr:hypothetical protein CLIB1423_23S00540 [[Candida] railenensis]